MLGFTGRQASTEVEMISYAPVGLISDYFRTMGNVDRHDQLFTYVPEDVDKSNIKCNTIYIPLA